MRARLLFFLLLNMWTFLCDAEEVADTKFSVDRGYYDEPISLEITTATEGAKIYYTTTGEKPGLGTIFTGPIGTLVDGPITIDRTTVIRARAFKDGMEPSNVDTHSYLFLADILKQPDQPEGAPERWGARPTDYEMDPRVVDDPAYKEAIIEGFQSIRTLSLVTEPDDFFSRAEGIYANPQQDGREWEREVSFEFIHPDGTRGAQIDGGIRIHGNGSRNANGQPKHGFRVEFRSVYGKANLDYRLFPDSTLERFDSLILRGQNAHGWTRASQISNGAGTEREQSQYIRDSYARDLMKAMGHVAGEATYVHLFINGLYWGLYNPVEYPRTYFGVSRFGGVEDDFDVINRRTTTTKILDGTFEAWDAMQDLANSGLEAPEKYAAMQEHIDVDNLIDYMLMHQYMGSRDGPEVFNSNNMRAIRKTRGEETTRWTCMPWDMEASMFEIDVKRNINVNDPSTLVRVYTRLRENPEFLLRYADRVHRHFFNDGTLTPTRAAAIWERRAEEIETAIIGESARWGDFRRPSRPFTRDVEWQAERRRLLDTYFPTRTKFLLRELTKNGLYPETIAPVFNQHGGSVPEDFQLTMEAGTLFNPQGGTFYYTTDGSDPRLPGGEVSPKAIPYEDGVVLGQSVRIRARTFDDSAWSALNEAYFVVDGLPVTEGRLAVSEIMYHPPEESLAEYIELRNVSSQRLDLDGVRFEKEGNQGINFDFSGITIPTDGAIVIVRDQSVFETVYGMDVQTAGEWSGGALNNAGEWLRLMKGTETLTMFRYNDRGDWPRVADGEGASLHRDGETWFAALPSPGTVTTEPEPSAGFTIDAITRRGSDSVVIEWQAREGSLDRVEFSERLDGSWEAVGEAISDGRFEEVRTARKGFYRIVRE